MSSSKKRKISLKTLKEKYEAIKKLESGCANKNVAADYVSPSTLSTRLKSKDKIVKAFEGGTSSKTQKLKPCGNENLERALYTWFVQIRRQGVPVSGPVLREKALSYAKEMDIKDFIASNSWFDQWKSRHGVAFKAIASEAEEMTASWKLNYALRDIFNADEFGLFYKALPDKSMHLKSEDCVGGKCSKVRLTGLAAASATGEKLFMFVIGKSKKPRCFNGA
ncbi:tigger transposable element-derived protein 4-like [Pocillopora verrucosa]|uniref:tigger transposable element-derived protein 4-like n=1 Tax=Pocillopora verrucosa TaxID=203993 RepID=UPI00333F07A4